MSSQVPNRSSPVPRRLPRRGFPQLHRHSRRRAGGLDRRRRRAFGLVAPGRPGAGGSAAGIRAHRHTGRVGRRGGAGAGLKGVVPEFRAGTQRGAARRQILNCTGSTEQVTGPRPGFPQAGPAQAPGSWPRVRAGAGRDQALDLARVPAPAHRRGAGAPGERRRLHPRKSLRRPGLHLIVRRPHQGTSAALVQHGRSAATAPNSKPTITATAPKTRSAFTPTLRQGVADDQPSGSVRCTQTRTFIVRSRSSLV